MSTDRKILISAVFFVWLLLLLQIAATLWYLYWILPWYDMLMHFLGGVWLGLMLYLILSRSLPGTLEHPIMVIFLLVSGSVLLGFLWEVMEFFLDFFLKTNLFQPNLPDTISDLALDAIGGLVAATGILVMTKKKYV